MWIGKWVMGSLVLGENLFSKAMSEALLWTVNEGENAITIQDRLKGIFINWKMYDYKIYIIILCAWLFYWIMYEIIRGTRKMQKYPPCF